MATRPRAPIPDNPSAQWKHWRQPLADAICLHLYAGQRPPQGWHVGRCLNICKRLHAQGEPPGRIYAVICRAATLGYLPPAPATMRWFWQNGERHRYNELAWELDKETAQQHKGPRPEPTTAVATAMQLLAHIPKPKEGGNV